MTEQEMLELVLPKLPPSDDNDLIRAALKLAYACGAAAEGERVLHSLTKQLER